MNSQLNLLKMKEYLKSLKRLRTNRSFGSNESNEDEDHGGGALNFLLALNKHYKKNFKKI